MACSSNDSIWKFLTNRNVRARSEDFNHYCNLCDLVMINAYISNCGCHYCKVCLDKYLEKGLKGCPGKKDDCRKQSLILNHDVFPDHSANISISKIMTKCPNIDCGFSVEYGKMEEHLKICEIEINECPYIRFGCDKSENKKENISLHLKTHDVNHAKLLIGVIDNLRNELNLVKNDLSNSKIEIRNLKRELEEKLRKESLNFEYKMDEMRQSVVSSNRYLSPSDDHCFASSQVSLCDLSDGLERDPIGGLVWSVANFYKLTQRAIANPTFFENSPLFLSHPRGYTLNLIMYTNGFAKGHGTHLYVGFCLAKGDYDDQLSWPFMGTVTISLVDQISGQRKFPKQFRYDTMPKSRRSVFDKPVKKFNYNCGDQRFIDLQLLRTSSGLVVNDCVMLDCHVDV